MDKKLKKLKLKWNSLMYSMIVGIAMIFSVVFILICDTLLMQLSVIIGFIITAIICIKFQDIERKEIENA
jgi:hypothetical protein